MKQRSCHWLRIPSLLLLLITLSCTQSPLSDDNSVDDRNIIRGRVALSDNAIPRDIFVWFEPFDISTRTDETGYFELQLPPAASQAGGGLSGIFRLYLLLSNYGLDSVNVTLHNGNLELGKGSVNNSGELAERIVLKQLLAVQATADKEVLQNGILDTIRVIFRVRANDAPVSVTGTFSSPQFKGDPEYIVGFVRKVDSDSCMSFYRENRGHRTVVFEIDRSVTSLSPFEVPSRPGMFAPGTYEYFPHIAINQPHVPPAMTRNLRATQTENECSEFLRLPITVENNFFTVTAGGGE